MALNIGRKMLWFPHRLWLRPGLADWFSVCAACTSGWKIILSLLMSASSGLLGEERV
jgi:hypothetical protein